MNQSQNFDQILESAVVANWVDLMRDAQSGLHVRHAEIEAEFLVVKPPLRLETEIEQ